MKEVGWGWIEPLEGIILTHYAIMPSIFESLPVELISAILSETDLTTLIHVTSTSRRLRNVCSDPTLNPWRLPILRNLLSGVYDTSLKHLSVHSTVPRQNWIEIISIARSDFILFEATLPNLKESEWEVCFDRRFLPSWGTQRSKDASWKAAFHKTLYRVWHRSHSSCKTDEAWTKYIVLNRNSTAMQLEASSRNFDPVAIFDSMKMQNNLTQFPTRIRLLLNLADIRILAFGVLNSPNTSFSVNENAWHLFHPPGVQMPEYDAILMPALEPQAPSRLRYPAPSFSHSNYPSYTPSGQDRRWVQADELVQSRLKWVGSLMLVAQLLGPHTMETWSDDPPLQDADFVIGPSRNQFASISFIDLFAIAPWMEDLITKRLYEAGLGH